eukprot:Platyproteum_vivax@DN1140_c0_g1_i2.p1
MNVTFLILCVFLLSVNACALNYRGLMRPQGPFQKPPMLPMPAGDNDETAQLEEEPKGINQSLACLVMTRMSVAKLVAGVNAIIEDRSFDSVGVIETVASIQNLLEGTDSHEVKIITKHLPELIESAKVFSAQKGEENKKRLVEAAKKVAKNSPASSLERAIIGETRRMDEAKHRRRAVIARMNRELQMLVNNKLEEEPIVDELSNEIDRLERGGLLADEPEINKEEKEEVFV